MNYRHAYHVGNIGDVLKHAVLTRLIVYLKRKDKAFRIIDSHAGAGLYDLTSEQTQKTGEWRHGIGKVMEADISAPVAELLEPWLAVLRDFNPDGSLKTYPGSPVLSRRLMRKMDRLTLTELHPEEFQKISGRFAGDHQVKVINLDGWLALGSFLPPKEKRGLVLIDPAFEVTNEFELMTAAVIKAWKKWPTGTYALWYHLKDVKLVRRMHDAFRDAGLRDVLSVEVNTGKSGPETRLLGSGMTLINPPFTFSDEMRTILPWLCDALRNGPGASWNIAREIEE